MGEDKINGDVHEKSSTLCSLLLFWIICITGTGFFIYQSYDLLSEYSTYPVVVNIEVETGHPLLFPAVTLCGYSKYRKDYLQTSRFCRNNPDFELCPVMFAQDPAPAGFDASRAGFPANTIPPPITVRFCEKRKTNTQSMPPVFQNFELPMPSDPNFEHPMPLDPNFEYPVPIVNVPAEGPPTNIHPSGNVPTFPVQGQEHHVNDSHSQDRTLTNEDIPKISDRAPNRVEISTTKTSGVGESSPEKNATNPSPTSTGHSANQFRPNFKFTGRVSTPTHDGGMDLEENYKQFSSENANTSMEVNQTEPNVALAPERSAEPAQTRRQRKFSNIPEVKQTSLENTTEFTKINHTEPTDSSKTHTRRRRSTEDETSEETTERLLREIEADTSLEERSLMGYDLKDIFKRCVFMGEECRGREFHLSYNFQFGNCWTLDTRNEDGNYTYTVRAGPQFAYTVDAYTSSFDRIQELDSYVGFRVIVHPPDEMPFPEDEGLNASPGHLTSIGVQEILRTWLPEPHYPQCKEVSSKRFFKSNKEDYAYSISLCHRHCLQKLIWEQCQCMDPRLFYEGTVFDGRVCNIKNQTEICCLEDTLDGMGKGVTCDCPKPCKQREYQAQISHLKWVPKTKDYDFDVDTSQLGRIEIFFKSMDRIHYKSKPKYILTDIFSNLGGEIGLWLGVSFITFYQIGEQVLMWLYDRYYRKSKRKLVIHRNGALRRGIF